MWPSIQGKIPLYLLPIRVTKHNVRSLCNAMQTLCTHDQEYPSVFGKTHPDYGTITVGARGHVTRNYVLSKNSEIDW